MSEDVGVELRAITAADIGPVAAFLHAHLNPRLSPEEWGAAMVPTWQAPVPDHGFYLRRGHQVVGAHLAFYSERTVDGTRQPFCNLGAWCVLDEYRTHGLRLIRALLRKRDWNFTDLSPSGNVIAMNERLGFHHLATTTDATVNVPWIPRSGVRVTSDPRVLSETLVGRDQQIYRDHAGSRGARHVLVRRGDDHCYVIFRHDRRKQLPLFASLLYVSDPELLLAAWRPLTSHLLLRHGVAVTLVERRLVNRRPPGSVTLSRSRPKMYRSGSLEADDIDYLYSELTNVAW